MRIRGRPLQFSLASALLMTGFAGAMMGVWFYREPWFVKRTLSLPYVADAFAVSNDERSLAIASFESRGDRFGNIMGTEQGRVRVLNWQSEDVIFDWFVGDTPTSLQFNKQNNLLLGMSRRSPIQLWNLSIGKATTRNSRSSDIPHLRLACFSPNGESIFTSNYSSVDSRAEDLSLNRSTAVPAGNFIVCSPNGAFLVFSHELTPYPGGPSEAEARAESSVLTLLDAKTFEKVMTVSLPDINSAIEDAIVLPSSRMIAAVSRSGYVFLVDLDSRRSVWRVHLFEEDTIRQPRRVCVSAFSNGDRIAMGGEGAIRILDTRNGGVLKTFPFPSLLIDSTNMPRRCITCQVLNNGDIVALDAGKITVFTRRFPEWWWGHFYRPEVWLAGGFGLLLLFRFFRWIIRKPKAAA